MKLCSSSSCMKPVSTSTMLSPRRARMKENGRSITPSAYVPLISSTHRLVLASGILDDEDIPVVVPAMALP